jgi:hypothetical protein
MTWFLEFQMKPFIVILTILEHCKRLQMTLGAFGGIVGSEKYPMVCGGFQNEDYTRDCFIYKGKEIGWEQGPSLLEKRFEI